MSEALLIGDILHFDGQFIGRIKSNIQGTIREKFKDYYENETIESELSSGIFDKIEQELNKVAQAGMVELGDIDKVLKELKGLF